MSSCVSSVHWFYSHLTNDVIPSSEADPKGSECLDKFVEMQDCMKSHKELYGDDEESDKALQDVATASAEEVEKSNKTKAEEGESETKS